MSGHDVKSLRAGFVRLDEMDVHLISIEISVVSFAVSIVHADGLLLGEDTCEMRHDTGFMESGLTVN